MTHLTDLRETVARALGMRLYYLGDKSFIDSLTDDVLAALHLTDGSCVIVPVEPTEAMLDAVEAVARD